MSCPHSRAPGSSPATCSQCLQATTAFDVRRVSVENGVLLVDDQPSGQLADINRARYEQETSSYGPERRKKCGRCGHVGHNTRTCEIVRDDLELN